MQPAARVRVFLVDDHRLFLAGVLPGLMLSGLFILWALYLSWRRKGRLDPDTTVYTLRERLELVPVSSERLLLVFNLRSGVLRTIFVEVPARISAARSTQ